MTETLLEHFGDVKGNIALTSAWGGVNGRVVQITCQCNGTGYIVMTFKEAKDILSKMRRAITKIEKEYNKNPPWWEKGLK